MGEILRPKATPMKQPPAVSRPDGDSWTAEVDIYLDSLNGWANGEGKYLRLWRRLAEPPETHATIERLIERRLERAEPELYSSDVVFFLYDALAVPDYWDYLRAKPKNYQRDEAKNLLLAAQEFHSTLVRHRTLASMYVSRLPEPGN